MGRDTNRRQRAVRLTAEALVLVQRRLVDDWQSTELDERLTWPVRAALLGVSTSTAKRILGRKGNDRAALIRALASLGLEWRDEYCEPLPTSIAALVPNVAQAEPPGSTDVTSPAEQSLRRPRKLVVGVVLASAALTIMGLLTFRPPVPDLPYEERPQVKALAVTRAAYHRAEYESARNLVKNAYRLAFDNTDPNTMSEAIRVEGEILAAQGDLEGATARYETALTFRTQFEETWARASLLIALAMAEQKLARYEDARSHLEAAYQDMIEVGDPGGIAEAARELGSFAARQGDLERARAYFDAASHAIRDRPDEAMHTDIRARRAMLLSDEGDHEAALKVLEECLNEWTKRAHPRWRATTLRQIGTVQWAAGQRAAARTSMNDALTAFESVGDRLGAQECKAWLAGHAPLVSRRTPPQ
ncbi:MAG TPA: tetratricopeptide repeat protein [Fimbriimonadaceae bacterium]|nr:tetratricopeptide repeat protein [Fimbriimonadaceae bacterium]HRJ96346.1 tetratricopeptide repeat protein [Fimbriimonadaceae bacterium]